MPCEYLVTGSFDLLLVLEGDGSVDSPASAVGGVLEDLDLSSVDGNDIGSAVL